MTAPSIVWFRDDLRLADHPALQAALERGGPVVLLYLLDEQSPGIRPLGGATRWWLHHSLAAHAAEIGADGVAVIPPPYFALDAGAMTAHFIGAAQACAPVPFFIYAFAARSGYPVPVDVVERVRAAAPNLAGLKVSESPSTVFTMALPPPFLISASTSAALTLPATT